jgi:hypothetical protein
MTDTFQPTSAPSWEDLPKYISNKPVGAQLEILYQHFGVSNVSQTAICEKAYSVETPEGKYGLFIQDFGMLKLPCFSGENGYFAGEVYFGKPTKLPVKIAKPLSVIVSSLGEKWTASLLNPDYSLRPVALDPSEGLTEFDSPRDAFEGVSTFLIRVNTGGAVKELLN